MIVFKLYYLSNIFSTCVAIIKVLANYVAFQEKSLFSQIFVTGFLIHWMVVALTIVKLRLTIEVMNHRYETLPQG